MVQQAADSLRAHADDFVHRIYERPYKTLHVLSPVSVLVVTECQVEAALLHMRLQPQRVEGWYRCLAWEPRVGQILRPNKKGLPPNHLVHLAQVVNVDAGFRNAAYPRSNPLIIAKVAQETVANAARARLVHLLSDRRQQLSGVGPRDFDGNRAGAGKPPHGTRNVDIRREGFASVAFQANEDRAFFRPAGQCLSERGNQYIRHLCIQHAGHVTQQRAGWTRPQRALQRAYPAYRAVDSRTVDAQAASLRPRRLEPAVQLLLRGLRLRVLLQVLRPATKRRRRHGPSGRLSMDQAAIGRLEVFQDDGL